MTSIRFDIETNGLLDELDTVFCICLKEAGGEVERYHDDPTIKPRAGSVRQGLRRLEGADELIAHGLYDFDLPALQKVYTNFKPQGRLVCSLARSRLIWSDIKAIDLRRAKAKKFPGELVGSHGLEAWGHRLGNFKGSFDVTDSSRKFTQGESDYCAQDVEVLDSLCLLQSRQQWPTESDKLEQAFAAEIAAMNRRGIHMPAGPVEELVGTLTLRIEECLEELHTVFPPFEDEYETPKKKIKKVKVTPFNPKSSRHIQRALFERYGFKPTEFTPSGEMKTDAESLAALDFPEVKLIIEYSDLRQLRSSIQGTNGKSWVENIRDGRVYPHVIHNGTPTGRCRHARPNTNVRAVETEDDKVLVGAAGRFGWESRSCWQPSEDLVMVGADASGIEFRVLAHLAYPFDGGRLANMVMEGVDIHQHNADLTGLTRTASKTALYASLYGAGAPKIGSQLGVSVKEGGRIKSLVLGAMSLDELIASLTAECEDTGFITGLDGRRIPVRSQHAVLNCANQGGAAVIIKLWTTLTAAQYSREFRLLIHQHDEMQAEEEPRYAPDLAHTFETAIVEAGQNLGLLIPLAAEAKIGESWAETH